ncbi:MAG: HTH domain-containing protein [Chloroflexi bacterium]|nr:HTH domain-containing protein [Chloroflexota bacterium]
MFGNKQRKQERLQEIAEVLQQHEAISQAALARQLQMNRATLHKDLADLEKAGILLAEDDAGRLSLFSWRRRR